MYNFRKLYLLYNHFNNTRWQHKAKWYKTQLQNITVIFCGFFVLVIIFYASAHEIISIVSVVYITVIVSQSVMSLSCSEFWSFHRDSRQFRSAIVLQPQPEAIRCWNHRDRSLGQSLPHAASRHDGLHYRRTLHTGVSSGGGTVYCGYTLIHLMYKIRFGSCSTIMKVTFTSRLIAIMMINILLCRTMGDNILFIVCCCWCLSLLKSIRFWSVVIWLVWLDVFVKKKKNLFWK